MAQSGANYTSVITTEYSGATFLADSAQFRLLGANDVVISSWANVTTVGTITSGKITLTIPGVNNTLSSTSREPRLIEVDVVAASLFPNKMRFTAEYVIEGVGSSLVVTDNSFLTYTNALLVAEDVQADLTAWSSASQTDRIAAMKSAFFFLCKMRYSIYSNVDDLSYRDRAGWGLVADQDISDIDNLTEDEFNDLPVKFIEAITRAQVVEADTILSGDTVGSSREAGVLSEKTGDDAVTYSFKKPVQAGISSKSLRYLKGYIKHTKRLIRS